MPEIENYEVSCDFCGKRKKFAETKQVSLKIEKHHRHQNLLATMCDECETAGARKTTYGQSIKETHKLKDEKSIFDQEENI